MQQSGRPPRRAVDARQRQLALSPDGQTMAMVMRPDTAAPQSLYTRRVNNVVFQKLGGTEDASQPFFSPDGRYVAFVANNVAHGGGIYQTYAVSRDGQRILNIQYAGDGTAAGRAGALSHAA